LPHPYIDPADTAAALKHWEEKRRTSTIRDWFSLYLGDPKPAEGALLTDDQVKASTYNDEIDFTTVKTGVAIDPNGGGRDVAGVIGGAFVDNTVVWTHDYSGNFGSDGWSSAACELAHEIDAGIFVYEHNYGGDQARLILRTVWKQLSDEAVARGEDDWGPCPRIEAVHAKKGKRVRAEPISAQVIFGKVKFYGLQVLDLGSEWQTWQEDSKESPGRIDASCYLAYKWLKVPGAEAVVSSIAEKPKQPTGKSRQAAKTFTRAGPGIGRTGR
jgi:phage terminase large subunit-like protein